MKKVLAVMLTLVLAFTFCIPSFADTMQDIQDAVSGVLESFGISQVDPDAIRETLEGALSGIVGGGESTLPDISNMDITPEMATQLIGILQQTGTSKEDIAVLFDQMKADGQINEESYNNLMKALEAAPETPTETPSVPDSDVPEAAQRVLDALHQAGVTDDQMKSTVDDLYQRGVIPQNVYEEIIRILDAQESTTASDNSGGGIRDFLGGIVSGIGDFFGGLFGSNDDDGNGDDSGATNTPSGDANSTDFGANDATGDTMIASVASVAAVAAIAGVALVLTKKKKDQ